MAEKEITVAIVDLSPSMIDHNNSRKISDLEYGLIYLNHLVSTKILRARKTDFVSLIACHTLETKIPQTFSNFTSMQNLSILFGPKQPFYNDLKTLNALKANQNLYNDNEGGILMAILLAVETIKDFVVKKKFKKNIIIITNGDEELLMNNQYKSGLIDLIAEQNINLVLMGIDFKINDKNKSIVNNDLRRNAIAQWKDLFQNIPFSLFLYYEDVIHNLNHTFIPKTVKPIRLFTSKLRLGGDVFQKTELNFDNSIDPYSIEIEIDGYSATKKIVNKNTGSFYLKDTLLSESYQTIENSEHALPIKRFAEYEIEETDINTNNTVQRKINEDEIIKCYQYATSNVPFSKDLEAAAIYPTQPALDIRGIINKNSFPLWYLQEENTFIFPKKDYGLKESLSFACIVRALIDLKSCAIARFVQKKNSEVQMVVLIPVIIADVENDLNKFIKNNNLKRTLDERENNLNNKKGEIYALVLSRLPFKEDEKLAQFTKLSEIRTMSGKVITENHELLPTPEMNETMEKYIISMDMDNDEAIPENNNNLSYDDNHDYTSNQKSHNIDDNCVFKTKIINKNKNILPNTNISNENPTGRETDMEKNTLFRSAPHIYHQDLSLRTIGIEASKRGQSILEYINENVKDNNGIDIVPEINPDLLKNSHIKKELLLSSEKHLKKLINLFEITYIDDAKYKIKADPDEVEDDEYDGDLSLDSILR
ncbi:ATP-dependent DNA helicase YKU80 [Ascoidea rubescens DSM 1968]|uniref:DNA helicase n=1 Tax=Ascoidea rubescens DSM 1968 TaxID=1344418 RepID=A0A1D2VBS7_9ASCO|nr:SPOC domain-like protein [Ascoidea rubescens DSM 1968]ODV59138.1 SPOC domain-like protein [Ascoidea rubescens DSM 1968]